MNFIPVLDDNATAAAFKALLPMTPAAVVVGKLGRGANDN
jgi:hypothetical protein